MTDCHEQGKKRLISGFKRHVTHTSKADLTLSITRPQAVRFLTKKGKKRGFSTSTSHGCYHSKLVLRDGEYFSYRYYLRSIHFCVHPGGMRIWTSLAFCSLPGYFHSSAELYECKQAVKMIKQQMG